MFENIGEKIKALAVISTIIGMLGSILGGFAVWVEFKFIFGLLIAVFGCLFSWIGSFTLYGFGELIDNTQRIIINTTPTLKNYTPAPSYSAPAKKQAPPTVVKTQAAPTPQVKPIVNTSVSTQAPSTSSTSPEQEQQYLFALQMIERRSYDIAYNTLNKIKGYKNVDELLQQLENRNQ